MAYGDGNDDKHLQDAWYAFCENLKQAGDKIFKEANPTSTVHRTDALRFLTQNLGQAFDLALETKDPAFPQIHPFVTPTRKLGGDVADFTYRQAWIDGNYCYKISGHKGSARWLNITVQGERPATIPGTDWPSLHEPFGDIPEANLLGSDIVTDSQGDFEVFIGGQARSHNWLPTTPQSRKLFIREAFDDWSETPSRLTIERLDMTSPRPLPDSKQMIEAIRWSSEFLTGAMTDWPEHSWRYSGGVCNPNLINQFPADKTANDASDIKRGRMAAHMIWHLDPDEALIVEMDVHAGFWIFGMGGVFMGSTDFLYRPVSYTPARTQVDNDNVIRLVIAHTDPGVYNWLDTSGFSDGNLTYRNLLTQDRAEFRTKCVKYRDLMKHMPDDTLSVNPSQREAMMLQRYRAIKQRYGI